MPEPILGTAQSRMLNGFDFDAGTRGIPDDDSALLRRRLNVLGPIYPLFYQTPLHIERASGAHIIDSHGVDYLDVYNNVPCVGHSNPRVAEAVSRQLSIMNTHTRYLQDGIVEYSERLLATFPEHLDRVVFTNSGSEANDLAIRIAREMTGNRGVIVTANAYHGTTDLLTGMSPEIGPQSPLAPEVRVVPAPDAYHHDGDDVSAWFAEKVREAVVDLQRHGFGVAALLIDSIMSTDGIYTHPVGFLDGAFRVVHEAGGLCIADEVQPGLGRTGETMWGFQRHTESADIVSMGKPMGNGIPMGGIALTADLSDGFSRVMRYFNTFGGNPVSIAAGNAVLDEIEDRALLANARDVGATMRSGLDRLATEFPQIGEVRGIGLFYGVEIVADRESKAPDGELTLAIVNGLKERRVLISAVGIHGNSLKIRPPLVFTDADAQLFLDRLHDTLVELCS